MDNTNQNKKTPQTPQSQAAFEAIRTYLNQRKGFTALIGIEVKEIFDGGAVITCEVDEHALNANQTVHGGLIFSLADMAAGAAAMSRAKKVTTLNANINYLRPGFPGTLTATATAVHSGRKTAVYNVDVTSDKKSGEKLIAKATVTMFHLEQLD